MRTPDAVADAAEPLIELLAAQCSDLEQLLALARRETDAAERRDFDEIMRVVDARATLGERLETYHRQIADMRARLGSSADAATTSPTAHRLASLVADIQTADRRTMPLLVAARTEAAEGLAKLDAGRKTAGAYASPGRVGPIALDRQA